MTDNSTAPKIQTTTVQAVVTLTVAPKEGQSAEAATKEMLAQFSEYLTSREHPFLVDYGATAEELMAFRAADERDDLDEPTWGGYEGPFVLESVVQAVSDDGLTDDERQLLADEHAQSVTPTREERRKVAEYLARRRRAASSGILVDAAAQIEQYGTAVAHMASAMLGVDSGDAFCKFNCDEIATIVNVLRLAGHDEAALFVFHEHVVGDDDVDDEHFEQGEQLRARSARGEFCDDCGFLHTHDHN